MAIIKPFSLKLLEKVLPKKASQKRKRFEKKIYMVIRLYSIEYWKWRYRLLEI